MEKILNSRAPIDMIYLLVGKINEIIDWINEQEKKLVSSEEQKKPQYDINEQHFIDNKLWETCLYKNQATTYCCDNRCTYRHICPLSIIIKKDVTNQHKFWDSGEAVHRALQHDEEINKAKECWEYLRERYGIKYIYACYPNGLCGDLQIETYAEKKHSELKNLLRGDL